MARAWEQVAQALSGGIDSVLKAVGHGALVIWRGGWRVEAAGETPELDAIVRSLRNRNERANVNRGLSDRMGHYGLQPVRSAGEVIGALVLREDDLSMAEPLAIVVGLMLDSERTRTEHAGFQKELFRTRNQLRDAVRVRTALLSQARHDLRTPLATMKGYADMISRGMAGPVNGKLLRYVERIGQAVDKECELLEARLAEPH